MVKVGISEFTFGFAFLYEQTQRNWQALRVAPILPNLKQEADEGWDARLPIRGTDFYYQFKLSDYLSRRNAKFIVEGPYNGPYYRIALHRRDENRQHRLLRRHCRNNPNTYYVAPEFSVIEEFNAAFLARQITERSRLIPISQCRDFSDGNQHYITFQEGDPAFGQHSDTSPAQTSFFGKEIEHLYRESAHNWRPIDVAYSLEKYQSTIAAVRQLVTEEDMKIVEPRLNLLEFEAASQSPGTLLARNADLLGITFGVTIVGQPR